MSISSTCSDRGVASVYVLQSDSTDVFAAMANPAIMWSFSVLALFSCLVPSTYGSAIPMWEYLSRSEKMNHLFNLFVQQVEKHCASRPEPDCSKLLLVYGLTNLAKMEDESLDDMDPYQRGANEIVWDSMMKGSSKHSHVQEYTTRTEPSNGIQTTSPGPVPVTKTKGEEKEDLASSDPGSLEAASNVNVEAAEPQSFLLGPMVVRVLPNGMPIPGEKNHLPKDEDIEEFAPSKFRRLREDRATPTRKWGLAEENNRRNVQEGANVQYRTNSYETFRLSNPSEWETPILLNRRQCAMEQQCHHFHCVFRTGYFKAPKCLL